MTVIQTAAVYAPSDDLPSFWDTVYEKLNSGTTLHKLIIGILMLQNRPPPQK
jgi:hypothetical protein